MPLPFSFSTSPTRSSVERAQPVEFPSRQRIPGSAASEHVSKALAAVISAGTDILKSHFAPCQVQRVELHGKGQFIGRDAGRNIFIHTVLKNIPECLNIMVTPWC
jgi:hypothetical protein